VKMKLNQVIYGDNREKLKEYPDNFFDGIITDPPYGMGFMGKTWDTFNSQIIQESKENYDNTPSKNLQGIGPDGKVRRINKPRGSIAEVAGSYDLSVNGQIRFQQWFYGIAVEMLRVAKPGSFLFCFGGTRTYHRVACAIEDAGWIIRDQIMWLHGMGFPKSTDISKAIDKEAGAERKVIGEYKVGGNALTPLNEKGGMTFSTGAKNSPSGYLPTTVPATNDAKRWDGYGTGLKPAWEPIIVAMKPLEKGLTYAQNAKKWGVAGLNIDGGRVGTNPGYKYNADKNGVTFHGQQGERIKQTAEKKGQQFIESTKGRWPANVILSHSPNCVCIGEKEIGDGNSKTRIVKDAKSSWANSCQDINVIAYGKETIEIWACVPNCPIRIMDNQSGQAGGGSHKYHKETSSKTCHTNNVRKDSFIGQEIGIGDSGGASRFFYCAKASKAEKEEGLMGFIECAKCERFESKTHTRKGVKEKCYRNNHPTVKPLALIKYLCTLLNMPNRDQVILDPFCGSGTTLVACKNLGINYVGIEQDMNFCLIATARTGD